MTVGELIAQLRKLDPGLTVVLSEDEEGNGFSPLVELSAGWFIPADADYYDDDDEDYEPEEGHVKAVALWP